MTTDDNHFYPNGVITKQIINEVTYMTTSEAMEVSTYFDSLSDAWTDIFSGND